MKPPRVELDFDGFVLDAELFDTPIARAFAAHLPYEVELTQWGRELYGGIGMAFGSHNPVAVIPAGGIAYTDRGNLVCIFFGQSPAWPVDPIGQIPDDQWPRLLEYQALNRVIIRHK